MQKVGGSLLCAELIAFFAPGFQAEDPQEHWNHGWYLCPPQLKEGMKEQK
jgi:hypothetical protein